MTSSPPYKPKTTQQFYRFLQEEQTLIHGMEEKNDKTALIYCTRYPVKEFFNVGWETFKPQYWSTRMSETDKILHKKLDLITSNLQMIISPQGTLHDLTNVIEIQKKADRILNDLSHKYLGGNAQKLFKAYQNYYAHKRNIMSSLCSYSAIGLLLPPYTAVPREVKNVKLMESILFTLQEKSKPITDTEIKITGKLQEQHELSDLQALAELRKIKIKKQDIPKLELYEGIYHLQPDKSVKSASLSIHFSFGENYKKTLHIHHLQQKLDNKYGKGKFHAAFIMALFFCLFFTSCSNDSHASRATNSGNIGGSIEGTTHAGQSSGARIQITKTGQTVTLNKPPFGDNPTVLDAYFAQQDTKTKEYKKINSAAIGDIVYIVVDTANLFAKKITVTIKDKNNIISGNIPFQQYKSIGNEFADNGEDVKGIFEAKVRNEINDQRFALYKIALKGKDEVTTKKWKEAIEKHSEKKLQLSLTVLADEENVIYCGSNDANDTEKNVWLNQEGKWFEVDICVCGDWANISSFIDKEDFIGGKTPGIEENCFAYALAEMERVNFTLKSKGWMIVKEQI